MCRGWEVRKHNMKRKTIRDLVGGAFLIGTAVVYFWAALPQVSDGNAPAPAVTIEAADSPSTEGV
jgi:hypothetical protein